MVLKTLLYARHLARCVPSKIVDICKREKRELQAGDFIVGGKDNKVDI